MRPLAGLLVLLLAAGGGSAQELATATDATRAPGAEGALDNDVFVPVAEPALELLVKGDAALARTRAVASLPPTEPERLLDLAFDEWHAALKQSPPGAWSWFALDPAATRRLSEGVRSAVERRLLGLTSAERERWSARLAPAASATLAQAEHAPLAERAQRLTRLVRLHPHTLGAARAALQLGDLSLEAGLRGQAAAWYGRAEREADLAQAGSHLAPALGPRRTALGGAPKSAGEPWRTAERFAFSSASTFAPLRSRPGDPAAASERGPRPGGTFLADGRFALQTRDDVWLYELAPGGSLAVSAQIRLTEQLEGNALELAFDAPRNAPGWPLLPAACGEHLAVVVGRSRPEEPNALLVLALEPAGPHADLGLDLGRPERAARTAWLLLGSELVQGDETRTVPELAALDELEFQPGPVASGDWIVVQARAYAGRVRAWLFAFDRRDGSLGWSLELASGGERVVTPRFAVNPARVAAQPLLAFELEGEPRLFAGTHLGLGAFVDGLTGEPLYGLKNRRRAEHEPGWSGDRPLLGSGPDRTAVLLWAPADSDHLYALRPFLLPGPGEDDAALLAPPTAMEDASTVLGGDAQEHLVLGRSGRARTVSARQAGRDRVDALDLGEDERFRGTGLVSAERVWVSTDRGLYLFDRGRQLYLLDSAALPAAGEGPAGGDLYARGAHVLVLGRSAVWSFLVR